MQTEPLKLRVASFLLVLAFCASRVQIYLLHLKPKCLSLWVSFLPIFEANRQPLGLVDEQGWRFGAKIWPLFPFFAVFLVIPMAESICFFTQVFYLSSLSALYLLKSRVSGFKTFSFLLGFIGWMFDYFEVKKFVFLVFRTICLVKVIFFVL